MTRLRENRELADGLKFTDEPAVPRFFLGHYAPSLGNRHWASSLGVTGKAATAGKMPALQDRLEAYPPIFLRDLGKFLAMSPINPQLATVSKRLH